MPKITDKIPSNLSNQFLIAMPQMNDPRFEKSLIYIIEHSKNGAMGIILNQPVQFLSFDSLLKQLGITRKGLNSSVNIHFGGPVGTAHGFVLHSPDYNKKATLKLNSVISLTATLEIIRDMAENKGPKSSLLALGYAGWESGQLEDEIRSNGWLHCPADNNIIFDTNNADKWLTSIKRLGFDPLMLSNNSGNA